MKSQKRRKPVSQKDSAARDKTEPPGPPQGSPVDQFPIVGIGASAGGLEAFTLLLKHLPADTGMGFVLVQHLDPQHASALPQILKRACSMPVHEVTDNLRVEVNHVYVIPPNRNLTIERGVLKLAPRRDGRRPARSIDSFFESLSQDQRERAIGVILSGTATDGTLGLEAIKAEGGITFAQDGSAKYDSMPRNAVAAGCVDSVLKPKDIAGELIRIAKHPFVAGQPPKHVSAEDNRAAATAHEDDETPLPSGGHRRKVGRAVLSAPRTAGDAQRRGEDTAPCPGGAENGYKKILIMLRNHCGVDFSLYKSTTIQRRITRRVVLNKENSLEDYANFLRSNVKELDALYSDVLISVTSFFRNPEAFEVLKRKVFPRLFQRRSDEPFRVWVLGCSTGQEAYSIAMAFAEAAEKAPRLPKLQVFATDLNDALLDKARHGLYARSLSQDVSPERLRRFFVEEDGGYRVVKRLREMVVFARQNLISDPPFSRMDLISCRNLLIYLEPSLQKKAIPTFHYALKPDGYLFLGPSESVGSFTALFEPVDKKHRIYSRKAAPTPAFHLPERKEHGPHRSPGLKPPPPFPTSGDRDGAPEGFRPELNAQREADRIMVNQFAPPGVLVNAELQILQFRGPTSAYLEPPTGKASFDVLKMAREGLMLPLRAAINKANKENKTARRENVRVKQSGDTRTVNVEVIPLKNLRERCFLILFEDAERGIPQKVTKETKRGKKETVRSLPSVKSSRRVAELERELSEIRDYMQSIQEQHEAANGELQASNEEGQSASEELQSVNEELETSKEELESANEELTTVNDEMANRNAELSRTNSDLNNFQVSTRLVIVLLGRDLSIRRFSAQAEKQFHLLAGDVGRPLSNVRHNLLLPDKRGSRGNEARSSATKNQSRGTSAALDLEGIIAEVIDTVREQEHEVQDKEGRWYSLRVRPYMTVDNKVDGAVLVLVDIDVLKRSEQAIAAARDYAENTVETVREPLIVLDGELRVESANRSFYHVFCVAPAETLGKLIFELGNHQWDIPQLRTLLEEILTQDRRVEDFRVEHDFEQLGRRIMLLNARRIADPQRNTQRILLAIEDVTEREHAAKSLARLAAIVESAEDAIISKNLNGIITSWNRGAERLFGYTAQEAVGRPVTMLIPPERFDEESSILERVRRGEVVDHYETVRRRKEGTLVNVSLTVSPIKNEQGQIIGASKITRDITEREAAEHALREAHELLGDKAKHLEVLVQQRTAKLKDALGELETFSYSVAHDLRAPLRAMSAYAEVLLKESEVSAEGQNYLQRIRRAALRLDRLTQEVLTYSQLARAEIQIQPVDLDNLARQVIEQYPEFSGHCSQIEVRSPLLPVLGHEGFLAQVLANLLINACKFVATGTTPKVILRTEAIEQGAVRIWVEDNGIGVAPEHRNRLFKMFSRIHPDHKYEGTGIGLAVVKKAAERMGGTVGFESEPGKGSQFWVQLKAP